MVFFREGFITHVYPSPTVNHCHAILNALRAALYGEESRLLSRHLLGLEEQVEYHETLNREVDYVEQLFSSFNSEETIILCLDDTSNESLRALFNQQLALLPEYAFEAEQLVSTLQARQGAVDSVAQELVAFFIGHTRARETYIEGLLQYADTFQLPEMTEHWSTHFQLTQQIVEEAKDLLIELNHSNDYSNYLLHRVYDCAVLIPASFRCQLHDMIRILHLEDPEFTFEDALFSPEEAEEWIGIGLNAEQAGYWRAYHVTPDEFLEWMEFGFLEPRQAGAWKIRGFSPELADKWALAGYDPAEADMYRVSGCDEPEQANSLRAIEQ